MTEPISPHFFKALDEQCSAMKDPEQIEQWQREVYRFKRAITFGATYPDIKMQNPTSDYSGSLIINDQMLGDMVFRWRCWRAFSRNFVNSKGETQNTNWVTSTFFLEVPKQYTNDDAYLKQVEDYYALKRGAIRCAIFELCEETHTPLEFIPTP